jgi:uncharacterized membrane protein
MPNIGSLHPQIVHFVVALLILGVAFRIVSLTVTRLKFTNYAAATLLVFGAVAAQLAVKSGTDAHGPVERIPGTRALVIDHEEHAHTTRTFFLTVAAIELIALALAQRTSMLRYSRYAHFASAIVGVVGMLSLYETAEHGGELVYSYAGGPGLRTGDPKDVERLLLAGLYNQSVRDRAAGRPAEAARLVDEMAKRFSSDPEVRLLHVESLLRDKKDFAAARSAIDYVGLSATDTRLLAREASLKADVFLALSQPDSARATLAAAVAAFPQNTRLKAKLDSIK